MSDSISLKVAFPNYKKYSDSLKSFINFFMSYSNLYMKLTPKDTSVNTTPVSVSSGGIYEDGVFKIIGQELVPYIGMSVQLQSCVLIQTAIGEITGEEPEYEPIVIGGTCTVTEENSAGVINITIDEEPSPGYTWELNRDELSPKFVPVVECDISACIKLDSTKMPFVSSMESSSDNPHKTPATDVFIPFTSNYKSTFNVAEEFIPEIASTFSVVDTALSLYDFPEQTNTTAAPTEQNDGEIVEDPEPDAQPSNSENTLTYNSSFSLPCKLIPYVNGNPNTDASYIPYDAVTAQNAYTIIDIPDSSNIVYQLRTSSFAVTSDNTTYTDVFYKVGVCSTNESAISTNDLVSTLKLHSLYVSKNKLFDGITLIFPEWALKSALFTHTIMATSVLSSDEDPQNTLQKTIAFPLYLMDPNSIEDPNSIPTLCGFVYMLLCNEDGTPFESDTAIVNNIKIESDYTFTPTTEVTTDPKRSFYISFTDESLNGDHVASVIPSMSKLIGAMMLMEHLEQMGDMFGG